MAQNNTAIQRSRVGCKFAELVLASICIGLHVHSQVWKNYVALAPLFPIVYGGYIIITAGTLLGFLLHDRVPKRVDLLFTVVGAILFISAGSIAVHYIKFQGHNKASPQDMKLIKKILAHGSLAIVNGLVMIADAILSRWDVSEYSPH